MIRPLPLRLPPPPPPPLPPPPPPTSAPTVPPGDPTAAPTVFPGDPTALPVPAPTPTMTLVPTPMPTMAECTNGVHDTDDAIGETDVDCGGDFCPPCGLNEVCAVDSDCFNGGSCIGLVCLYPPTTTPTPAPTGTPTPAPTRTPIVEATISITGITCADDFDADVLDEALDSIMPGAAFTDATCEDVTGGIGATVTAAASYSLWGDTYDSLYAYVVDTCAAAVSDGSFDTAIA